MVLFRRDWEARLAERRTAHEGNTEMTGTPAISIPDPEQWPTPANSPNDPLDSLACIDRSSTSQRFSRPLGDFGTWPMKNPSMIV